MDPAFIPPFPGSVVKCVSNKSAFAKNGGTVVPFLAWRDGEPAGRNAAIIHPAHNARYADKTGFFGFFDAEDDPDLARGLFNAAEQVLREHGLETIRGPYNPTINDECGLLVDGFAVRPTNGLTWNPAYHEGLVEGAGFVAARRMFGFDLPLHRLEPPPRLERITARVRRTSPVTIRPLDVGNLQAEMEIILEVYNATLERNWGFVPITIEDLAVAAEDLRAIADPDIALIAELNGERAGVAITLPDFNTILAKIKNTPHWLRLPHILWLMKTTSLSPRARFIVYGISPRFRDRGLHGLLLFEQFVRVKARYHSATLGWVEESNTEILDACDLCGADRILEWRIYEKPIAA